jgi:hypothetical protein
MQVHFLTNIMSLKIYLFIHILVCRLCMNEDAAVNIFEALEENVAISDAITCCVPLIKVFIYSFIN